MPLNAPSGTALTRPTESILGIGYSLLIGGEQTDGAYELMLFEAPVGSGAPPHVHRNEDELFYIVDGEFEVLFGEARTSLNAGSFIHLPRGTQHAFRNTGDSNGRFLCWVVPGNLTGFFDAFKRAWPVDQQSPSPVGEEDIARLMAAAQQYEIEILAD